MLDNVSNNIELYICPHHGDSISLFRFVTGACRGCLREALLGTGNTIAESIELKTKPSEELILFLRGRLRRPSRQVAAATGRIKPYYAV